MDESHHTLDGILEDPSQGRTGNTDGKIIPRIFLNVENDQKAEKPRDEGTQNQDLAPGDARFFLAQVKDVSQGVAHGDA